jgi:hypothetical protein
LSSKLETSDAACHQSRDSPRTPDTSQSGNSNKERKSQEVVKRSTRYDGSSTTRFRYYPILVTPPDVGDADLYDNDGGVKQHIMRAFGFYDHYLPYQSTPTTRKIIRSKGTGHNWVSVDQAYKAVKHKPDFKILTWNFCVFHNQLRAGAHLSEKKSEDGPAVYKPTDMYARGIFLNRAEQKYL